MQYQVRVERVSAKEVFVKYVVTQDDFVFVNEARPDARNPESETRNPKSETRNPKFETRNFEL